MNLDLRIPMGLMFTFTGAILTTWGIKTNGNATSTQRASASTRTSGGVWCCSCSD